MATKKAPPEYENFLPFDQIMSEIDLDKVAKAIVTDKEGNEIRLMEFDYTDAKRLVWLAAEKFLPRDLYELKLEGLELRQEMQVPSQRLPFKGFLDIAGVTKGLIDPFKPFAGKRAIIDWKTSKNTLDTTWRNRLLDSFQWMCYAESYQASLFMYRGLSRNGTTAEIIIQVDPEKNKKEVLEYLTAVGLELNVLREHKFSVFPRNKPFACGAYGRDCQYKKDCEDYTMPQQEISADKQLSYSFANTFMLCQEKARRESLTDGEGSGESLFGNCVHSGLAELYKQAYEKFGQS